MTHGSEEWTPNTTATGGGRTGPSGTLQTGSTASRWAMAPMWCFLAVSGDGWTMMVQTNFTTFVSWFNNYMNLKYNYNKKLSCDFVIII